MKYVFVVNPAAGKGNLQKQLIGQIKEYFETFAGEYEIHITTEPGDAERYVKQQAQTGEQMRIFACGGEGTSFEVVNGVFGYDNVAIGVIPCGSANDFLKYFDAIDPFSNLASQTGGSEVPIDLIRAGDRYCINGCSVGMDAMVARDMSIFKHWPLVSGSFAYKLAILRNFLKFRLGVRIDLSVDGAEPRRQDCLFAVIANAPYYGGGFKGAPNAHPNDGELDFTMINNVSHFKVLRFLPKYEKGEFEQYDFSTTARCSEMFFRSEKTVPINLDGEIVEAAEMKFSIVPQAVRFVLPVGVSFQKSTKSAEIVNLK
ncbi:MAG: diacylglycerol kinase family lipid kinase [Clostridia bacterium]|nr:diacylglycerol kinase family lipid kinase [Clostridia bacterium]